jgi:hypothetical protein
MRYRRLAARNSRVIGNMPFIWLAIDDEAGPKSTRDAVLLARNSGLRNSNHVDECYDPAFLYELERLVSSTGGAS